MYDEVEYRASITHRTSSAIHELGEAYCSSDREGVFRNSTSPEGSIARTRSREALSKLSETLEHLTAEHGKSGMTQTDEDGCPSKPRNFRVFRNPYLEDVFNQYRECMTPEPFSHVLINFRIMKRNAGMYVGYLLSQKGIRRNDLYKAKYLPIWTQCVRFKVRMNIKVGVVFQGLKSRLGVASLNELHFCMDGFYGVEAFGDAFGNVGSGICPWMELAGNGTAKSLHLNDGDNIYVSVATEMMQQMAQQRRLVVNGFRSGTLARPADRKPSRQDGSSKSRKKRGSETAKQAPREDDGSKSAPRKGAPSKRTSSGSMQPKDSPPKDSPSNGAPPKDSPSNGAPPKDSPSNGVPPKSSPPKNASSKSAPPTSEPPKNASSRSALPKITSSKSAPPTSEPPESAPPTSEPPESAPHEEKPEESVAPKVMPMLGPDDEEQE